MEWEPQVVMLDNRKHVNFNYDGCAYMNAKESTNGILSPLHTETHENFHEIKFYTQTVNVDIGNGNLEVRSQPVKLQNFLQELRRVNIEVGIFMEHLAYILGPCALIIPETYSENGLSKHLNLSTWPQYFEQSKDLCELKDIQRFFSHERKRMVYRVHCKVPYNFRLYHLIPRLIKLDPIQSLHLLLVYKYSWCVPKQMVGISQDGKTYQKISNIY